MITILDCYTDEPAGLGVPPYIGTYPRYIAGKIKKITSQEAIYITIDDLRKWNRKKNANEKKQIKTPIKTDIYTYNTTDKDTDFILKNTNELIIILGVHTPGKYLRAVPGTFSEVLPILEKIKKINKKIKIIFTGPGATPFGSGLFGGKKPRIIHNFETKDYFSYDNFEEINEIAPLGAYILEQIPFEYIIELETGIGCIRKKGCSFCTEPLKHNLQWRTPEEIIKEVKVLKKYGANKFRLGKQSCFYSYMGNDANAIEKLLKGISALKVNVLHIDNVNPVMVNEKITKLIVEYCTPGNVAAFGVESFDPEVIKINNLNSTSEKTYKAIKIINKYGKYRGSNGMPKFLPGINLLFGLPGESKKTHEYNMRELMKYLKEDLLIRRINIRQVVEFPGTMLEEINRTSKKTSKKMKKYYWKWRNEIRQKIDFEMLKKIVPKDTILKDVYLEIYHGKHTFGRQFGSYPLIVGINEKTDIKKFVDVKITSHNLRSVTGEILE